MTETTPKAPPQQSGPETDPPLTLAEILMNLIVILLAPMFLSATGGDISFARMAALETVNGYRSQNQTDLLSIAQIIAFGLAALGSLSLSMADDLSLTMTLRLRGNANALNRSAEHSRRALRDTATTATPQIAPAPIPVAPKLPAETQNHPKPAPLKSPTPSEPALTDQQIQAMWATAMTDVAGEYTASLAYLPPTERKAASRRAAALSSCAHDLLTGTVPTKPRIGGLNALIQRPNAT
jgi:hypothetical protein